MTKHKKTKRNQKGGEWLNPATWFSSSQPTIQPSTSSQSWSDYIFNFGNKAKQTTTGILNSADSFVGQTANTITEKTNQAIVSGNKLLNQDVNLTGNTTNQTYGGKRKRHTKKMRGGKGGLGLTYYAAPVSGLQIAKPTTWQYYANGTNQYTVKGGSRKHRNKRTLRNKKY